MKNLRLWFNAYVHRFYGDDEYVNENLRLKDNHSRRTCEEILYLAEELGLSDNQKRIAETIALLHDIGRFKQFVTYRTYNDPRSVNHCLLGVEVLRDSKVLDDLDDQEREFIEKAIEYHGQRELPEGLDGQCLLFSKLIRDADKVDIYRVVTDYYAKYQADPDGFKLEVELPDEPWYSAHVVKGIMSGEKIHYNNMRTLNDMKLLQLAWVYDVNFTATLKRIRQRGSLEKIIDFLPTTEDIKKVESRVLEYVDERIRAEG